MPFINKKQALKLLDDMIAGKQSCIGDCRRVWLRLIGNALKSDTNPLKLTKTEHKTMTARLAQTKDRKKKQNVTKKVDKKYLTRDSPPYPANEHCGKTKKGNDGQLYESVPDKNKICRWKLK